MSISHESVRTGRDLPLRRACCGLALQRLTGPAWTRASRIRHKREAYECGVEPTSPVAGASRCASISIAMLFVIFDVEAASFYPWAVRMHALRVFGLLEMVVFIVVLAIGYAYVWKKGGFVWR